LVHLRLGISGDGKTIGVEIIEKKAIDHSLIDYTQIRQSKRAESLKSIVIIVEKSWRIRSCIVNEKTFMCVRT